MWVGALGQRIKAPTALRIGLINYACEEEGSYHDEIDKIVDEILSSSPSAVRQCKKLINKVTDVDGQILGMRDFVCNAIAQARVSPDGQEGTKSFLEKRRPWWSTDCHK